MLAEQAQSFFSLAMGFAIAGLIVTGYQVVTRRPASFRVLQRGPRPSTLAAVPLIVFAAPFIIMRNTMRARRIAGPESEGRRIRVVMLATIIAGFWSLVSGTIVVMALVAVGIPAG
jgi:hypothetical protein